MRHAIAPAIYARSTPTKYEDYSKMFEKIFSGDYDPAAFAAEGQQHVSEKENTSIADYVWLPFRFDGEMAYLDWQDEWRIEDYE